MLYPIEFKLPVHQYYLFIYLFICYYYNFMDKKTKKYKKE